MNIAADFDQMKAEWKERVDKANTYAEKVQLIMAFIPSSLSREKVIEEFQISERVFTKAKELKEAEGILPAIIKKRAGNRIPATTIDKVTDFFLDEESSRFCPGVKEYKMINVNGEKTGKPRRLLLLNLKEAYVRFKKQISTIKIGFSKICSFRPNWVITADASGAHNVCVCFKHQNPKLMLEGAGITEGYRYCLDMLSFSTENELCMLTKCEKYPGPEVRTQFLNKKLEDVETVSYSEYTTVDRRKLMENNQ